MSRHGKNCTAGAVYTYHERLKDSISGGYGLQKIRMSKDSMNKFNACCLTLQPCINPVITPNGFLYEREAILEYIFHQKKEYSKKLKVYQNRMKKISMQKALEEKNNSKSEILYFKRSEDSILPNSAPRTTCSKNYLSTGLKSFWIPTLTPDVVQDDISKPDKNIYCPMSGNPLSLRDLVKVSFKASSDEANTFVCSVTGDNLGNSVPCAVLRPTGDVVTLECVEKLIKSGIKETGEMTHPITGNVLEKNDIIKLRIGGMGFSGSGAELSSSKKSPSLMF
ncbi:Nitric oxide synthase-interacting protein [Oopsacas minuta]|uniref:Nitric oxide synthase-interacting protein n=1 Tax=Oopsacas minuta TaxID=111878 RepID=A0AAV7JJQ5_9METZ|nr:Nitric oxide synthase-interacting protein [Oopsacas minuta]